ncbi:ParA family protein [Deinococcus maricopensis]|uniref:ParA family chromosome partitioning ATPase n=1 Tax=Deinococcus maricopensis (strain DSM 21211 / LMG 22137 / NRRL B-23946 / LB-34) TaxID=709986 RepID=E8U9D1_DEIML|nr:ParA family protein [Deinococcus maricopensis]ADV67670.1 ParA family chromosome partitioning ATPase [Deinococcus maricopensis DSM 21211]
MKQRVAVTSEKGGVGKSTLAVHLAGAWVDLGVRVVLLDGDDRVGSSLAWHARGPGLPFDVFAEDDARPKRLADADVVLTDTWGRPKRKELRAFAQSADLIVIPTGVSPLELESAAALDAYLRAEGASPVVVLTRVPPVGGAAEAARARLRAGGTRVAAQTVRAYAAYTRAAEAGVLVRDVPDERAPQAWTDVLNLARELHASA